VKESTAGRRFEAKSHRRPTASNMTDERWIQIEELFNALVDLPGQERDLLLLDRCARDPHLRHVLERLLDAHDRDTRYAQRIVDRAFARPPRFLRSDGRI